MLTSDPAKHAIPKTAEVHIPLALASLAGGVGQGWSPTVHSQTDAPGECDLWAAWRLFPLDDDQACHSGDGGGGTFRWPVWEDIAWVIELLYSSVKKGSHLVFGDQIRW